MQRIICLLALSVLLTPLAALGARAHGEIALQTNQGPVQLYPIHHASFVLRWNEHTIYVDPTGAAAAYAGIASPDLVLITHAHSDHLDEDTLAALDTADAVMVMPKSVADKMGASHGARRVLLANGESAAEQDISIAAMAMYNLPESPDAYHPKGWGNGYVLTLGGKRIYISGDTEGTPEMRSLKDIDLAFVCMNLPYTMGVEQAADAVADFQPAVVYPYHYRGQDTAEFKRLLDAQAPDIRVRLRDWYGHAAS